MSRSGRSAEEEILLYCGIIAQLSRSRASNLLRESQIPFPLYVLLGHFCHDPEREWTVGQLAAAFEVGQPGMTKQVRKLLDAKLVRSRPDANDGRVRWLSVTAKGEKLRADCLSELAPSQKVIFADWNKTELRDARRLLRKLKNWLDDNRLS